jgi:hypothetical protein
VHSAIALIVHGTIRFVDVPGFECPRVWRLLRHNPRRSPTGAEKLTSGVWTFRD